MVGTGVDRSAEARDLRYGQMRSRGRWVRGPVAILMHGIGAERAAAHNRGTLGAAVPVSGGDRRTPGRERPRGAAPDRHEMIPGRTTASRPNIGSSPDSLKRAMAAMLV